MTENDRALRCQTALRAERLIYRGRGRLARGLGKRFFVIFVNYVNNANYVKRR